MPNRFLDAPGAAPAGQPAQAAPSGNRFLSGSGGEEYVAPTPKSESGMGTAGALAAGAAGLAAVGYGMSKLPGKLGKVGDVLNAIRMQSMLSGKALPKSMLGNVGAVVNRSLETGSTRPIRELLSKQTLQDIRASYKTQSGVNANPAGHSQVNLHIPLPGGKKVYLPTPGRAMGALDEATQKALRRSGATAEEAANETLQTPLGKNFGPMGEALEGPVAQYLVPFRRTPFNQAIEGAKAITKGMSGTDAGARRALSTHAVLGSVHGAATADDNMPASIPFAAAAAGRYGVPYALAALIARTHAAGGKGGGGIASGMLPVSEYGIESAITDPLRPFYDPAINRFFK